MKRDAIRSFKMFLEIDLAKPILELIELRNKKELSEHQITKLFPQIRAAEDEYRFHLIQLSGEVGLLYRLTSPYIHEEINRQNRIDVHELEASFSSLRELRKTLKQNNKYQMGKPIKSRDGEIRWGVTDRDPTTKLDEAKLKGKFFEEYFKLIHRMFHDLRSSLLFFSAVDETPNNKALVYHNGYFNGPTLKNDLIKDWQKFEAQCERFYKKGLENNTNMLDLYIDPATNAKTYKWRGKGRDIIPTLRQFLKMLMDMDIYEHGKYPQKDEAKTFLDFFGVNVKDPGFLFRDFRKDHLTYKVYFRPTAN